MNVSEQKSWPSAETTDGRRPHRDGGEAGGPASILAGLAALFGAAALAAAVLGGCAVDGAFVQAVDGYAAVILPEYRAYVAGDEALSVESKRIRLQTADRFEALIDAALESAADDAPDAHHDEGGERAW